MYLIFILVRSRHRDNTILRRYMAGLFVAVQRPSSPLHSGDRMGINTTLDSDIRRRVQSLGASMAVCYKLHISDVRPRTRGNSGNFGVRNVHWV